MNQSDQDPFHPIIQNPHEYEIQELHWKRSTTDSEEYIDLTLQKESIVRRVRFFEPRDICIEKGFPVSTNGMEILDVRKRGMEGIGVRLGDFEASNGSITFWAREVVDLDK